MAYPRIGQLYIVGLSLGCKLFKIIQSNYFMQPTANNAAADVDDGADTLRRSIGPTDYHPLSVGRFAPSIKRLKRIVAPASKLASAPTAYPQAR